MWASAWLSSSAVASRISMSSSLSGCHFQRRQRLSQRLECPTRRQRLRPVVLLITGISQVGLCDVQRLDGVLKVDVSPIVRCVRNTANSGQPVLLVGVALEASEGALVVPVDDDARLLEPLLLLSFGLPIAPFQCRCAA